MLESGIIDGNVKTVSDDSKINANLINTYEIKFTAHTTHGSVRMINGITIPM